MAGATLEELHMGASTVRASARSPRHGYRACELLPCLSYVFVGEREERGRRREKQRQTEPDKEREGERGKETEPEKERRGRQKHRRKDGERHRAEIGRESLRPVKRCRVPTLKTPSLAILAMSSTCLMPLSTPPQRNATNDPS